MEMQSSSDHEAPDTSSVPPPPPPSDGAPLQDHALLPQSIEHPFVSLYQSPSLLLACALDFSLPISLSVDMLVYDWFTIGWMMQDEHHAQSGCAGIRNVRGRSKGCIRSGSINGKVLAGLGETEGNAVVVVEEGMFRFSQNILRVAVQESEMSEEEVKGVLEAVASTGKFWQDWEKLKGMLSWWLKKVCSGTLALCLEYILSFYSHPDDYSISLSIRCALKVLSEYPEPFLISTKVLHLHCRDSVRIVLCLKVSSRLTIAICIGARGGEVGSQGSAHSDTDSPLPMIKRKPLLIKVCPCSKEFQI
ncbi:hypothetical protein F2Q68_00007426 [Brassica cretica]|uniref:Uncharacterized protein n=1 Tax=Brassica cretica TaxID=69181 RepID=A0A8S9KZM6_BRACR|nr:hypothetical protein F2Q68_00007426 [Brassica cretica]